MPDFTATGVSCANIAFIKYWGNRDHALRIPSNGSISMNLGGLITRTTVTFDTDLKDDVLLLEDRPQTGASLARVCAFLERVRQMAGITARAQVESTNNFLTGAGIASSASAFAALSLAASCAAGLRLSEPELSRLARTGSGSACRSVPAGFVEWRVGEDDSSSYAFSIAPPDYWDLVDCVTIISRAHKTTGSTEGHALADTSPLQAARLADAPRRLERCREAILSRDFELLSDIVELDSNLMHAVMLTSDPRLIYWHPASLEVMHLVTTWRSAGMPVCYTIDAGPNIHVITTGDYASEVSRRLLQLPSVFEVIAAHPGGPTVLA